MSESNRKSVVFALTAVFFWSTVATAFKIGLAHYSPAQLLMVASATSSLVLLVILLLKGESTGLVNLTLKQIAVPAFLGLLNHLPFVWSYSRLIPCSLHRLRSRST
jgi:uncharacterized membrane protein